MSVTPMKILMVHDDKMERGQLAIMLARFEHGVEFASEISLTKINLDKYDLIIVDEHLSEGSGIVLLQQFSAKTRSRTIFLSSNGEKERAFFQSSLGIYECMGKPVKPMDLAVTACDFYVFSHLNDESLAPLSC
jgi:DNA-binding response OmpR family regulator